LSGIVGLRARTGGHILLWRWGGEGLIAEDVGTEEIQGLDRIMETLQIMYTFL
jgi:hypothetical protein